MSKPIFHPVDQRTIQADIDRAVGEGRHSSSFQTLCQLCRQWVDSIFHTTFDKKRICRRCAIAIGVPNAEFDLQADGTLKKWEGA